jgi:FkbM family methyltransferase
MQINLYDKLHMYHRFWRYRLRTERPSIFYLLDCDLEGKVLVDIGANKGIYSYWMSKKAGRNGVVFAFEPQPELGVHLEKMKKSFTLDNLRIVNNGLSSSGILKLMRSEPGSGGASFHLPPDEHLEELDVPVTTLDEFFNMSDHRPISFIKCDVEKHECDVFKGGHDILSKDKPILLFECWHHEAERGELFSYLTDLGYDGFFYYVRQSDHASHLRRAKGKYVHFSQFKEYSYVKPPISHRNYIFVRKDKAHYFGRVGFT